MGASTGRAHTISRARLLLTASLPERDLRSLEDAFPMMEECVAISREVWDGVCLREALRKLGYVHLMHGWDAEAVRRALPCFSERRVLIALRKGQFTALWLSSYIANALVIGGDREAGRQAVLDVWEQAQRSSDSLLIHQALIGRALLAQLEGDDAEAVRLFESCFAFPSGLDNLNIVGACLHLAALALRRGDGQAMAHRLDQWLDCCVRFEIRPRLPHTLDLCDQLAIFYGEPERGVRLTGAAAPLYAASGWGKPVWTRERFARDLALARTQLGAERFAPAGMRVQRSRERPRLRKREP
ncbi:MAG TPA: hypothetical protein VH916_04410 [Dehalococcoidia bacterium]